MHRIVRRALALAPALSFFLAWAPIGSAQAHSRSITDADLLRFRWVADPQISPDGAQVAYTLVRVNASTDRYETSLWIVASDGQSAPRRLTAGPRDGAPRWSPDSRTLAFVRTAGDTLAPQLYLLAYAWPSGDATAPRIGPSMSISFSISPPSAATVYTFASSGA